MGLLVNGASPKFRKLAQALIHRIKDAAEVKKHATTYKALEFMYNFQGGVDFTGGVANGAFAYLLQHLLNPMALRNRLKLATKKICESIAQQNREDVTIFSLGSGSARSVIAAAKRYPTRQLHLVLLDQCKAALEASERLVANSGIRSDVTYLLDTMRNVKSTCAGLRPDIVEMVGTLDYLNKKRSIQMLDEVFDVLPEHGVFITGNVLPNREEPYVTHVIGWHLVYKTVEELEQIVRESKFDERKASITLELLRVHAIMELRK